MSSTLEAVCREAMVLPPDQRVTLAQRLLASVEPDPEPGASEAWEAEIASRMAAFDEGKTQTIPASEVFARLRKIAPGQ